MDVKNIKGMRKKGQNKKPPFRIYNTLSKKIEDFKPLVPGKVGMYVCGVTAYDFSHIGHARAAVVFDILFRFLLHLGYQVTYVRNFTDIDDKDVRLVYKTFATLYFVFIFDNAENELAMLDLMQVFVESLDKCFSNVCELDIEFNFKKGWRAIQIQLCRQYPVGRVVNSCKLL